MMYLFPYLLIYLFTYLPIYRITRKVCNAGYDKMTR